jgi:hypothetical protein
MKKIAAIVLMFFIAFAIIQTLPVRAPFAPPKQNAINLGLAWLAKQQDSATGAWNITSPAYYPVASTAFAVIKFATYKSENPTDTTYDKNVLAGLKYLLSFGSSFQFDIAADPALATHWTGPVGGCTSNGDGIGIYFKSVVGVVDVPSSTYETGIVMMALQAADKAGYINRMSTVPAGSDAAILGKTYYTVMGDMVNFYAWAQNDPSSGVAEGGWRYYPNMEDPNGWGSTSDNSVSQWAALGLISAEAWGINANNYVKTELLKWLAYSQNANGGFGYTDSSSPYVPMTAAGLIELTYCGVPTTGPRWSAAASFICSNWASGNIGNMYAMYAVMKAAMTATPAVIWSFSNSTSTHMWQPEYDNYLVNASQTATGYWPATGRDESPTVVLATEWALLILEKAAPPPPPPVGGVSIATGTGMLASYIVLASTLAAATVATAICTKRVKRGKEKQ